MLSALGCNGTRSKIIGTWRIDPGSVKSAEYEAWKNGQGVQNIGKQIEVTRYEFKGDGTLTIGSTDWAATYPGTWELSGQKIVVSLVMARNNSENPVMTLSTDGAKIHVLQAVGTTAQTEMDLVKLE